MSETNKPRHDSTSARDYALAKLDSAQLPGWKPRLIKKRVDEPKDPHQWAVGEAIYIGAVKNLLTLKHRVAFHAGKPITAIDELGQKILVVAAQQLVHMPQIPAAIVVDQAVAQCKRFGHARLGGLVNAVLRNFGRQEAPPPPAAEDVERGLSFPPELFQRLSKAIGKTDAKKLAEHANGEPAVTVRLAPGIKPADLRGAFPHVKVIPHAQPGMVAVEGATRADFRKWAAEHVGQVQDPTAAAVVAAMDLKPGMTVLDRCAGVGTKTLQIANLISPGGTVHAIDPAEGRIANLERLARQLQAPVVPHRAAFTAELSDLPAAFDRVLVDAPCSNSGVMARRPEARYRQGAGTLKSLEKLQLEILADSAPRVAVGGLLVYSTCSIWPEENERIVKQFLSGSAGRGFTLLAERTTLPDGKDNPARYRDGGYTAVLIRAH